MESWKDKNFKDCYITNTMDNGVDLSCLEKFMWDNIHRVEHKDGRFKTKDFYKIIDLHLATKSQISDVITRLWVEEKKRDVVRVSCKEYVHCENVKFKHIEDVNSDYNIKARRIVDKMDKLPPYLLMVCNHNFMQSGTYIGDTYKGIDVEETFEFYGKKNKFLTEKRIIEWMRELLIFGIVYENVVEGVTYYHAVPELKEFYIPRRKI